MRNIINYIEKTYNFEILNFIKRKSTFHPISIV